MRIYWHEKLDLPEVKQLEEWLHTLGLGFNPFDSRYLDAGADPRLSSYLVGHQAFDAIWKDQISIVFAPTGGGKSSFRVRLTQACRVGQDGRRIFPIVYKLPDPNHFYTHATILDQHFHFIVQKMAEELLLLLLYRPEKWKGLSQQAQQCVADQLWNALPIHPISLLDQLYAAGNFTPLLVLYDPTADQLPAQPTVDAVRMLCSELVLLFERIQAASQKSAKLTSHKQFEMFVELLRSTFEYESLYLLIDGVDAYLETTDNSRRVLELLEPLWRETTLLDAKTYAKYFLPMELKSAVTIPRILPYGAIFDATWVDIHWTQDLLSNLLAARLRVASQGKFDNLNAISTPAMRRVHAELIDATRNSPREVLVLAGRLLWEHIQRPTSAAHLEPEDLQKALIWYHQQRGRL